MRILEKLSLAIIVAASIVFAVHAAGIRPPARLFPLFVSVLTGSLAALALARSVVTPLAAPLFFAGRGAIVLASMAGFVAYVLILPIGYIPSTLVFLFASYLYLMPKRSVRTVMSAALVAMGATAFTWLCFSYWLGVNLPSTVSLLIPWPGATRP